MDVKKRCMNANKRCQQAVYGLVTTLYIVTSITSLINIHTSPSNIASDV